MEAGKFNEKRWLKVIWLLKELITGKHIIRNAIRIVMAIVFSVKQNAAGVQTPTATVSII
ncbi:MAG: hypothetical protein KF852_02015 [Saprospiraceae bacterium]|nr:hypothetical protein [Saprospiraceae bacterium]